MPHPALEHHTDCPAVRNFPGGKIQVVVANDFQDFPMTKKIKVVLYRRQGPQRLDAARFDTRLAFQVGFRW